ncbi:hypothetical protein GCM10010341_85840 [Streptomyces noursei]|nr:hypothetical protein GCM10010341_85840 [Streptomyces noursei]
MSDLLGERAGFVRRIGLLQAIAINMSQMCGIGPFVTIPLMVTAFGGPQAVIGFVAGAVLALADGLVWAELGASLPGAGGSYVYLRQAFQYRTGKLMPFLFVWTAMILLSPRGRFIRSGQSPYTQVKGDLNVGTQSGAAHIPAGSCQVFP